MLISLLLLAASQSAAPTDFGIRAVGGARSVAPDAREPSPTPSARPPLRGAAPVLARAAQVGGRFGRVTSTWRSPEHNRRVGGARNSWHLQGRAIDIARHGGARHAEIAAELRRSGLYLIESIDEGDHSHFAFATGPVAPGQRRSLAEQATEVAQEASYFRFVTVPATAARRSAGRALR